MNQMGGSRGGPVPLGGSSAVLTRRVGDAILVLADNSAEPVLLDGAARTVWERLDATRSVGDLVEELATEFQTDVEVMSTSVDEVLGLLAAHGLIEGLS